MFSPDCVRLAAHANTHNMRARAYHTYTLMYTHHPHAHPCKRAVHGNTKSGRVRDHHFVHTSLKLEIKDIKDSNDQQEVVVVSTMPPGLSGCTSDHFLNRKNVENDTALEFLETEMFTNSGGARADKSNQQEVAEEQVVLQGIDLTKAVTFCLGILERVRNGIRDGFNAIETGIRTLSDLRQRLFSEQGKVYEGIAFVNSIKENMVKIDERVQSVAKTTLDPTSAKGKIQEIKLIVEFRMKQMTKEVHNVQNFFNNVVTKALDQLNEYPPILVKNLKPLTDLLAKVMQVGSLYFSTLHYSTAHCTMHCIDTAAPRHFTRHFSIFSGAWQSPKRGCCIGRPGLRYLG